jgi:hypothetical protein
MQREINRELISLQLTIPIGCGRAKPPIHTALLLPHIDRCCAFVSATIGIDPRHIIGADQIFACTHGGAEQYEQRCNQDW